MDSQNPEVVELGTLHAARTGTWIQSVLGLLDTASRQLEHSKVAAQSAIERASALLQQQVQSSSQPRPRPRAGARASRGLLAWEIRKVRDYVDARIADRVLVSDLSAVVRLSEAYFSRSFRQTLGLSPHAFVMRRRVDLAAQLLLESVDSLAAIALRCGFTDQPHLCNQFRKVMGETPGAWRCSRRGEIGLVGRAVGAARATACARASSHPEI